MNLAIVSSFPPKACGVGEFCADLVASLSRLSDKASFAIYAIDNVKAGYPYKDPVVDHFFYQDRIAYRQVADKINQSNADIVLLQHEFNLFGGRQNEFVLDFIQNLQKPLVTVIHNIPIDKENSKYRYRIDQLVATNNFTSGFVTMSDAGKQGLIALGIPAEKVFVIVHGAPKMPPLAQAAQFKKKFDLENRFTLMTFGLMRPKKGIEYLLDAVAMAKADVPNVFCLIIGARDSGDKSGYYESVKKYAMGKNSSGIFRFVEAYLAKNQLYEYIIASDVIVTPYLKKDQISSGPLTFAVGAGIPVISTPYLFAKELLSDIGILVPFSDSNAIKEAVVQLATDKNYYLSQQEKTINKGWSLSWDEKAKEYYEVFLQLLSRQEKT